MKTNKNKIGKWLQALNVWIAVERQQNGCLRHFILNSSLLLTCFVRVCVSYFLAGVPHLNAVCWTFAVQFVLLMPTANKGKPKAKSCRVELLQAWSEPMSRMIWPIEMLQQQLPKQLQQQLPPDASNNSLLDSWASAGAKI